MSAPDQTLTAALAETNNANRSIDRFLDNLLRVRANTDTHRVYSQWASNYDTDIDRMEYHGGQIAANCFLNLNYEKDVTILDIGAGTGIIGKILHNNGYRNIDALDANETMLEELRQKNCYRNVFNSQVTPDTKLPFEKQTYDVVILAGVFCPGHIQVKSLEQIIPIVKSGGLICWSMGQPKTYADRDEQYKDENFERYISSLCDKCKWLSVLGYPCPVDNYLHGLPGLFYAMQVI